MGGSCGGGCYVSFAGIFPIGIDIAPSFCNRCIYSLTANIKEVRLRTLSSKGHVSVDESKRLNAVLSQFSTPLKMLLSDSVRMRNIHPLALAAGKEADSFLCIGGHPQALQGVQSIPLIGCRCPGPSFPGAEFAHQYHIHDGYGKTAVGMNILGHIPNG